MTTHSKDRKRNKTVLTEISDEELESISGGPNRRDHDHIGNFNFKVEIEGATLSNQQLKQTISRPESKK